MIVELLVDTGRENGIKTRDFMTRLENFHRDVDVIKTESLYVGQSISILDTIKLINQSLHNEDPRYFAIPESDELIAQELLLYENSGGDNLNRLADSRFSTARITLKLPTAHAGEYTQMVAAIEQTANQHFAGVANTQVTGMITLFMRTSEAAIHNMSRSYIIATVVISLMMMLLMGSMSLGLVAMIPNLFPIIAVLGIMGYMGLPLDIASILVGSIALGLSVDDTIHFMHHFKRYFSLGHNAKEAVRLTIQTAGPAMLFTTLVLAGGFYIFLLSEMNNLFSFGLTTGSAIVLALIADLILAPALMTLATRQPKLCSTLSNER